VGYNGEIQRMSILNLMKNCEGCAAACDVNLRAANNEENQICPCTNCLVKMICSRTCEEYYMFHQHTYEWIKEQKRFAITASQLRRIEEYEHKK